MVLSPVNFKGEDFQSTLVQPQTHQSGQANIAAAGGLEEDTYENSNKMSAKKKLIIGGTIAAAVLAVLGYGHKQNWSWMTPKDGEKGFMNTLKKPLNWVGEKVHKSAGWVKGLFVSKDKAKEAADAAGAQADAIAENIAKGKKGLVDTTNELLKGDKLTADQKSALQKSLGLKEGEELTMDIAAKLKAVDGSKIKMADGSEVTEKLSGFDALKKTLEGIKGEKAEGDIKKAVEGLNSAYGARGGSEAADIAKAMDAAILDNAAFDNAYYRVSSESEKIKEALKGAADDTKRTEMLKPANDYIKAEEALQQATGDKVKAAEDARDKALSAVKENELFKGLFEAEDAGTKVRTAINGGVPIVNGTNKPESALDILKKLTSSKTK